MSHGVLCPKLLPQHICTMCAHGPGVRAFISLLHSCHASTFWHENQGFRFPDLS